MFVGEERGECVFIIEDNIYIIIMGRHCNISLFGGSSRSSGLSLFGGCAQETSLDSYSQEYSDLKEFINIHFMIPLIKKDIDIINLNTFNFTYLTNKLKNFSSVYKDTEIFIKLIDAIRAAIEITNENNKLYELVYGEVKDTTLMFRTTAVEFVPAIQIYIQLYGKPTELSQFDEQRLHEIKQLLSGNETITFEEIKVKLGYRDIEKKNTQVKDGNIKIAH